MTTSVSSSFFLLKIPYGISQNRGQMISFLKRKKGEEYRRGLGKMYWQQAKRQIKPAARSISYECSGSRHHECNCIGSRLYPKSRPLLSSFFAYFSYQKKGRIRCFQDFQRDGKSKLYSHFFSVFSLYR